jgi:catechol 2,3-dioxygenase-like lactoylglutathione lyase family enzyme
MERSIEFYRDALGFTVANELRVAGEPSDTLLGLRGVDLHAVYVERDGFRLELLHFAAPRSPAHPPKRVMNDLGFTHLSVQVAEVDAALERLEQHGVRVDRSTRIVVGGVAVAAFVRDPDGLPIELVRRTGS